MIRINTRKLLLPIVVVIVALFILSICLSKSIIVGDWTKQAAYQWGLNCWHIQAKDAKPTILLIDDDSGKGIFSIKHLCDELNLKATFAVVPGFTNKVIIDTLKCWQRNGFGISIHGYNHKDWRNLSYEEVVTDIEKCEKWLRQNQFDMKDISFIVSPHGANSSAIRKAIKEKGYQMVTGANLLNPDTKVFQLGRVMITKDTDLGATSIWLKKAKERKLFVILGTHASIPGEFSIEKTKAVLQMAIDLGFEYQQ